MRILAVAGIRSQYIKLYSIQKMLSNTSRFSNLELICIDAGQHYDYELASGFIDELGISFQHRICYENKDPMQIFSEMIYKLYDLFIQINAKNKIDYIMCFGDANTTMATAIAASKSGIELIHVEAGLRLGNLDSPEEGNRIVADHLASKLFVSNKADMTNIHAEGLSSKAFFAGDIIQDVVLYLDREGQLDISPRYYNNGFFCYNCDDFVIASMHRKENIRDNCLVSLFESFNQIPHNVLFLAHPSIISTVMELDYDREKITVANYIPYLDMLSLVKKCRYLITDSGAFQREAYYLKKRCLIRQDKAFWNYLVEIGVHLLAGKTTDSICRGIKEIEDKIYTEYTTTDYFGSGQAVETIFGILTGE